MNKISKLKNFNKILLGMVVFFVANSGVLALCTSHFVQYGRGEAKDGKISAAQKKACTNDSEKNFKCEASISTNSITGSQRLECLPSKTKCIDKYYYDSSEKKCVPQQCWRWTGACPKNGYDGYDNKCVYKDNVCTYANCGSFKERSTCESKYGKAAGCVWNGKCVPKEKIYYYYEKNANGGFFEDGSTVKNTDCSYSDGCYVGLPTVTMSNKILKGWSTSKDCKSIKYSSTVEETPELIKENTTFYACWEDVNDYQVPVVDPTGPICGDETGKEVMEEHLGGTIVTKTQCNQAKHDDWYSIWSGSCCKISKRNGGKYTVLFDEYKGYGISCNEGTAYYSDGICSIDIDNGKTTKFPVLADSKTMYRAEQGYGKLIGWDKEVNSNGEPICQGGDDTSKTVTINKTAETAAITSDTTYKACYKEYISGNRYLSEGAIADGGNEDCGTQYYIDYCLVESDDNYCYGYPSNGTDKTLRKIYRSKIFSSLNSSSCTSDINEEPKKEEIDDVSKCSPEEGKGQPGLNVFKHCYKKSHIAEEIKSDISKLFKCPSGYSISKISNADGYDNCVNENCSNNFNVTCSKGNNAKPRLAVSSAIADSTGYGDIKVTATAQEGVIQDYFVSPYYVTPTDSNEWISLNGQTSFTYNSSPGVLFFWVRDSRGNISNAVSGAVFDTKNTDTTVKDLSLVDDSGNYQAPTRVSYNMDGVKDSGYVMMSNNLNKDSKVLADGFNPFDMQYELEVESPTITVYATLTSTDSNYVDGYEPRTVNLNYGINTILIKIENKEGKTRTYTILVTRKDTRTSDNTLSDISLSEGNITFNANVTDYKVEIPKSTTSVNVNSTIASDKASYVSGYEPGNVSITGDTTVKLIKVKSETGSTRTYVITFVKEGTDVISKESLQLSDLVIPNAYLPFESDVSNYSLSVSYEIDTIDINTVRKDKDSSVLISIKKKTDTAYKVVSDKGIGLDVGENFIEIRVKDTNGEVSYYRLTVIRKEFGLGISNDTSLKELRVLGYDIDFEPNKKEYTVRIKQEKTLVVTAVPASNRAEVFIRGNEELTGFSTVRVKVVAENGEFETYSIDIKKDAFNKTIEIAAIVAGIVIILASSAIILVKKKSKAKREYFEE